MKLAVFRQRVCEYTEAKGIGSILDVEITPVEVRIIQEPSILLLSFKSIGFSLAGQMKSLSQEGTNDDWAEYSEIRRV